MGSLAEFGGGKTANAALSKGFRKGGRGGHHGTVDEKLLGALVGRLGLGQEKRVMSCQLLRKKKLSQEGKKKK